MKKVLVITSMVAIIVMGGCRLEPRKGFVEFPVSKAICFHEILVPGLFAMPAEILIHNETIIVWDNETDWFLKVFSLEDFDYLGNLVRRGRGPDEETELSPFLRKYGNDAILLQSAGKLKLVSVNVQNDVLKLELQEEINIPSEMYDDAPVFIIDRNLYSSCGMRPFPRDFHGYNLETGQAFEWGELPPLRKPAATRPEDELFLFKTPTLKPDNRLLAIAYHMLPVIRIYGAESGHLLHELHKTDASVNESILLNYSENSPHEKLIGYYFGIKSTNEFIYALYSGKPSYLLEYSEIHVWDWDGNPVMKLEFDKPIMAFDISPDNKQVVAVSIHEPDKIFHAEILWD